MKNPKQFTLQQYSGLAGASLLIQGNTSAQAVYTNLYPDVTAEMDPEILNIDMNGDGVLYFAFMNEIYTIVTSVFTEPQSYIERIWAGPKHPDNAIAVSVLKNQLIDISGLAAGCYLITISDGINRFHKRLIKTI